MRTILEVTVATLGAQDQEPAHSGIRKNASRAQPPNEGVSDEVDLFVVLHPEVLRSR